MNINLILLLFLWTEKGMNCNTFQYSYSLEYLMCAVSASLSLLSIVQCGNCLCVYLHHNTDAFSGPLSGGTIITVTGLNLLNDSKLQCRFNDTLVPHTYMSSTQMLCETPVSLQNGTVYVEVSTNNFDYTTNGVVFTFYGMM